MRYFAPSEYQCKCGKLTCSAPKELDHGLATALDDLRARHGQAIWINSGIRCPEHNAAVGGKPDSEHLTGKGVDLRCTSSRLRYELLHLVYKHDLFRRVGIHPRFLHLGVSDKHDQDVCWLY